MYPYTNANAKFLVYALATWRLSRLLVKEDGPGHVLRYVREATGIEHDTDGNIESYNDYTPLHCVFCTSLWAAVLLYFTPEWLRTMLAASGVALMAERYGPR